MLLIIVRLRLIIFKNRNLTGVSCQSKIWGLIIFKKAGKISHRDGLRTGVICVIYMMKPRMALNLTSTIEMNNQFDEFTTIRFIR